MLVADKDKADDDIESAETTALVKQSEILSEQSEIPFCGCISIRYYQPVNLFVSHRAQMPFYQILIF